MVPKLWMMLQRAADSNFCDACVNGLETVGWRGPDTHCVMCPGVTHLALSVHNMCRPHKATHKVGLALVLIQRAPRCASAGERAWSHGFSKTRAGARTHSAGQQLKKTSTCTVARSRLAPVKAFDAAPACTGSAHEPDSPYSRCPA